MQFLLEKTCTAQERSPISVSKVGNDAAENTDLGVNLILTADNLTVLYNVLDFL